jgi:diguanylate cyclase (GGDEF)-like protein
MARDGHLVWLEVNLRLASIGGEDRILGTARNITDRKRSEMDHSARLKAAEAQNAVSLALAGVGPHFEEALDLIGRYLSAQIGDLCSLDLLDEGDLLRPVVISQPYIDGATLLPALDALEALPLGALGPGRVAQGGEALRLENLQSDGIRDLMQVPFHRYFEHFKIHSLLIVPMRSEGRTIGTITMAKGGSSRAYSAEDQAMLQNLADRAALTISNARLYGENLRQAEALRVANQVLEQRVEERTRELEEANARLHTLATEDALTRLANRRHFNSVLDAEIRRARRTESNLSLIMGDVDYFKRYNDRYGHLAGDGCLQMVGEVMREIFRRSGELPARYGGEEFAVILPTCPASDAQKAAEKLRSAIENQKMPHESSDVAPWVTISLGLVTARISETTTTDWLIGQADDALYRSKEGGRNRVTPIVHE